jgi:predicted metal-binding membrane protein
MPPAHDRLIPFAGIVTVCLIAWAYLASVAYEMSAMAPMVTAVERDPVIDAASLLVMWWVMMAAMMLPSSTMMIMTFATVNRRSREREQPSVGTGFFAAGYLIGWGGFSVAATAAQWGLDRLALMSAMDMTVPPIIGGVLLIAAGLYQFTPLKHACLRHCRSPFNFILNRWREGRAGAVAMGLEHGLYCLGCCWVMMALLFVFGVMNLIWIAALTALVLAEKVLPRGPLIAGISGIAMIGAGGAMLVTAGLS